ncbi:peptidyl-prolyl cis-trans isomerase [Phocaeicola salanitronis]|uniref:peptidyl-prolyl cis-trans isomerase n=1 Tax=Phocaeicola salanitronis TaxID=376805 RepID=UPI0025A411BA|nr:peptidyl-prolyl cis-trans isomerase [Phocaeicola salanitronis]MDM8305417.1 peptidyl-prolyl cis-trans isomerase [Phocaeicola salanitronis]
MNRIGCLIIGLLVMSGCSGSFNHQGKTPLVEVGDAFLYKEDLDAALPVGIHDKDSVRFAEDYIRNWVEDVLLYGKAEGNIPDNEKIDQQVAAYRRALIMHTYQEELVRQKLGTEVSEEEIEAYYEAHAAQFRAEQPYIQGLFMKVPVQTRNLNRVRNWYKRNTQDAIDGLEKFSIAHAVSYEYFYDRWRPVSEFALKMPLEALETDMDYLKRNKNVEVRDTVYCYFLHVEQFLPKGDLLPLEYAKNEIKEMIINLKRVAFINQIKNDLYREASENNDIIYYKPDNE